MKIFTCSQVRDIDRYTIENEPVASYHLMERAAGKLFEWIVKRFSRSTSFVIFTGPGNNGGDGLVLARLLHGSGYTSRIFHLAFTEKVSADWQINYGRLTDAGYPSFCTVRSAEDLPVLSDDEVVIDAILGSGLARPADGLAADAIRLINSSCCRVISVDMPSGLFGEDNSENVSANIIRANYTLTFQFPKLAMMFPENYHFTGEWHILNIGLHPKAVRDTETPYFLTEAADLVPVIHQRSKFDHKGIYGHGLLVAGSKDKAGAAVLSSRAALRSGIGLLTCHTAGQACAVIQAAVPETMIKPDADDDIVTSVADPSSYSAVGVGPGLGVSPATVKAVEKLITECSRPMVIDADAINIIGAEKSRLAILREGMILTPHIKEFERIAGKTSDGYSRLKKQIEFSAKYKCIIVLKGAHTSVSLPDGRVYFNSTGNPGMATAGSGDVLTGIILSLLAQGYDPRDAAIAGVFLHGLSGDIASESMPYESIIASDIIDNIGNAFIRTRESFDLKYISG